MEKEIYKSAQSKYHKVSAFERLKNKIMEILPQKLPPAQEELRPFDYSSEPKYTGYTGSSGYGDYVEHQDYNQGRRSR